MTTTNTVPKRPTVVLFHKATALSRSQIFCRYCYDNKVQKISLPLTAAAAFSGLLSTKHRQLGVQ